MRIPPVAQIDRTKLTDYLLTARLWDDKSKFLGQAGFLRESPELLETAIRQLAAAAEAVDDGSNPYGTFWRVEGPLLGPNGTTLKVVTIWLEWSADGSFHFVTLKPFRSKS